MNTTKSNSPIRLIAFFLIGVILVGLFGFSVDGWDIGGGSIDSLPMGDEFIDDNAPISPHPDDKEDESTSTPEVYIPEFTSNLTGLECDEISASLKPLAFIYESTDSLFGAGTSEVFIEYPIENGQTIYIGVTRFWDGLNKIGYLGKAREGLDNISSFFSALLVSMGNEDSLSNTLDISCYPESFYTEYKDKSFTKNDYLSKALSSAEITLYSSLDVYTPFNFKDFTNEDSLFGESAEVLTLYYSDTNLTSLHYSNESKCYSVLKNSKVLTDHGNKKELEFSNCFILFADSVTYENESGSKMILNTMSSGLGYYASEGVIQSIRWFIGESGELILEHTNGDKLTVNRGKSYISFMKSSEISSFFAISFM